MTDNDSAKLTTWDPEEYLTAIRDSAYVAGAAPAYYFIGDREPEVLVPANEDEASAAAVPLPEDSDYPFRIVDLSLISVSLFLTATGPTDRIPLFVFMDDFTHQTLRVTGGRVVVVAETGAMYLDVDPGAEVAVVIAAQASVMLSVGANATVAVLTDGDLSVDRESESQITVVPAAK